MDDPSRLPRLVPDESDVLGTGEAIEALQELMELIWEDAGYPSRVKAHADQADKLLWAMKNRLGRR
jgi:hypothetical protein